MSRNTRRTIIRWSATLAVATLFGCGKSGSDTPRGPALLFFYTTG